MKDPDIGTTRRSLLFSGAALAGLFAIPLVPAALGGGLETIGSALARHGADDGPDDDGHHTGGDDSGHHGGDDDDDAHDADDDNPGQHNRRGRHKDRDDTRGGNHHGPNHS